MRCGGVIRADMMLWQSGGWQEENMEAAGDLIGGKTEEEETAEEWREAILERSCGRERRDYRRSSSRVPGGGDLARAFLLVFTTSDPPISSEPRLSACPCHAELTRGPRPPPSMADPLGDLMSAAAARGDVDQLVDLLRRAPDVDAPNRFGRTALQVMRLGNPAIARLLLRRGANPNLRDSTGFSVLHDAARAGFQDTVQTLLDFQANVNIQDNEGNLPLHLAAKEGHLPVVKFLVLHTDTQVDHRNRHGDTPSDMARLYNRQEVLQWMEANARGQAAQPE
ncbi:cyclin-dependent kinase 4 inhibitor C [Spea bombifrons]|uniref:cyclin-dependent kinase 4 inhibitor C n=1 Tax=Spea bombifrons TaxID=233779 RepID=UPI00234B1F84|nr:cyclin-dependent kinase 4 inhibitor C [Spea bombifrons]